MIKGIDIKEFFAIAFIITQALESFWFFLGGSFGLLYTDELAISICFNALEFGLIIGWFFSPEERNSDRFVRMVRTIFMIVAIAFNLICYWLSSALGFR